MAYIGKAPNTAIVNQATSQSFSGNGSTTAFTLTRSVNVGEDLEVFVNNVQQEPGSGKSYTASGTTLTFDEAPPSGTNNVYVIYRGEATINPRLEHDANAALAATTGTFTGDLTVDTSTLKVDATNNRVGVGTASPTQATLHVDGGSVPARFESTSASTSYVQFGASGTTNYGQIAMTGNAMTFRTSYTDRVSILASGGLTFNGDTAAANALDDYEEGSWTPIVAFGGGTSGITYGTQFGRYVKIGELVMLQCTISMTSKGSSTGAARIQGMPFNQGGTGFHCTGMQMFNFTGGTEYVVAQTAGSSNEVAVIRLGADQSLDSSDFANNTGIRFSIVYRI